MRRTSVSPPREAEGPCKVEKQSEYNRVQGKGQRQPENKVWKTRRSENNRKSRKHRCHGAYLHRRIFQTRRSGKAGWRSIPVRLFSETRCCRNGQGRESRGTSRAVKPKQGNQRFRQPGCPDGSDSHSRHQPGKRQQLVRESASY